MRLQDLQEAKYHSSETPYLVEARDFDNRLMDKTGPFPTKQSAENFIDNLTQRLIQVYERHGLEYGKDTNFTLTIEQITHPEEFADDIIDQLDEWL